jgi:hypothetical protein
MIYAVGLLSLIIFTAVLRVSGVVQVARKALDASNAAMRVLRDAAKSELEKERAARAAGLNLFGCALGIVVRFAFAAAMAFVPAGLGAAVGAMSFGSLQASLLSPWMLLAGCALSIPAFVIRPNNNG